MTSNIANVIRKLSSLSPGPRTVSHRGQRPFPVTFQLEPTEPWDEDEFELALAISLPDDLRALWREVGGARIFVDAEYGQWGLDLWSHSDVLRSSPVEVARRPRDCMRGDLFIGKFIGDQELLLLRCDRAGGDFGQVQVALEIDPRDEWPVVGPTLADFLARYILADGDKYWT